jgi:glycosyltransferase involved in cell wall biosynthesis
VNTLEAPDQGKIQISVVVGVFNETEGIGEFIKNLCEVLQKTKITYEVIIVDDGSTDSTLDKLKEHITVKENLVAVELLKNYGQVKALSAGMSVARGRWIIMMDGDMQHDPSYISTFIEKNKEGYDLIATFREKREEPIYRKIITWLGNRINRFLVGIDIKDFGSAFRMFDAGILVNMKDLNGYVHYNTPQLYASARRIVQIPIVQKKRKYGSTKWTLGMFISFNMDFVTVSPKLAHILIAMSFFGFLTGCIFYMLNMLNVFSNVLAISAPAAITLSSIQLAMIAVIWREVIVGQNLIKGIPPYIIQKIWRHEESGNNIKQT